MKAAGSRQKFQEEMIRAQQKSFWYPGKSFFSPQLCHAL